MYFRKFYSTKLYYIDNAIFNVVSQASSPANDELVSSSQDKHQVYIYQVQCPYQLKTSFTIIYQTKVVFFTVSIIITTQSSHMIVAILL